MLQSARIEGSTTYFDAEPGARASGGARKLDGWSRPDARRTTMRSTRWRRSRSRREAGIDDARSRAAMAGFSGVKRRFQLTGKWNGVAIYDDYGHHPAEIAAVLGAARRGAKGRVIAVVEPHRYTRVRDLFGEFAACFKDADTSSSRRSTRRAKVRSTASTTARWPRHPRRTGTRRWRPSMRRAIWCRPSGGRRGRATSSSASAPATRPNGRMRCPIG